MCEIDSAQRELTIKYIPVHNVRGIILYPINRSHSHSRVPFTMTIYISPHMDVVRIRYVPEQMHSYHESSSPYCMRGHHPVLLVPLILMYENARPFMHMMGM